MYWHIEPNISIRWQRWQPCESHEWTRKRSRSVLIRALCSCRCLSGLQWRLKISLARWAIYTTRYVLSKTVPRSRATFVISAQKVACSASCWRRENSCGCAMLAASQKELVCSVDFFIRKWLRAGQPCMRSSVANCWLSKVARLSVGDEYVGRQGRPEGPLFPAREPGGACSEISCNVKWNVYLAMEIPDCVSFISGQNSDDRVRSCEPNVFLA